MIQATERAPAKINLYLDVTGRRDDGFHDVVTVMQTVSLADEITVSVDPASVGEVSMELTGNRRLPSNEKNLAVLAAREYLDAIGAKVRVTVGLHKRIPVSAGLAGGSTDAAATLRALNRLFEYPLTAAEVGAIAAKIGSDVPYCLVGGTARCVGRGEIVEPLDAGLRLPVVVSIAAERISTPVAYHALDEAFGGFADGMAHADEKAFLASLSEGKCPPLYNIFETAVLPECPGARAIKEKMLTLGAASASVSGSGPSVYGVFLSNAVAQEAKSALMAEGYRAYVCHPVPRFTKI